MNKIKATFFVFACWIAAKAIRMRAKQMLLEGIFVDSKLPIADYCKEIFEGDFGEVVFEFIES